MNEATGQWEGMDTATLTRITKETMEAAKQNGRIDFGGASFPEAMDIVLAHAAGSMSDDEATKAWHRSVRKKQHPGQIAASETRAIDSMTEYGSLEEGIQLADQQLHAVTNSAPAVSLRQHIETLEQPLQQARTEVARYRTLLAGRDNVTEGEAINLQQLEATVMDRQRDVQQNPVYTTARQQYNALIGPAEEQMQIEAARLHSIYDNMNHINQKNQENLGARLNSLQLTSGQPNETIWRRLTRYRDDDTAETYMARRREWIRLQPGGNLGDAERAEQEAQARAGAGVPGGPPGFGA